MFFICLNVILLYVMNCLLGFMKSEVLLKVPNNFGPIFERAIEWKMR